MLRRCQRRRLIIPIIYIPLVVRCIRHEFRPGLLFSSYNFCGDVYRNCGYASRMYQQRRENDRYWRGNTNIWRLFPLELDDVCHCCEYVFLLFSSYVTATPHQPPPLPPVTKTKKGYGVIYPATGGSDFHVPRGCVVVGVLGSFEAYLGVLFAGTCCAILFRKVLRSQTIAQVFFSDPIVVRFGKGELSNRKWSDSIQSTSNSHINGSIWRRDDHRHNIMMTVDENKEDPRHHDEELGASKNSSNLIATNDDDDDYNSNIPCPSLEFRLVNRLHDVASGEIGKSANQAVLD